MEAFFLTCVVVAFFVTKGRTDTAAYSNGKEPPGLARARMRHENAGGARTSSGRPTGRGAFGLLVASRWANACQAAQQRGEHRAARRRAWYDATAPGRDERWRAAQQRRLERADRARARWAHARGLTATSTDSPGTGAGAGGGVLELWGRRRDTRTSAGPVTGSAGGAVVATDDPGLPSRVPAADGQVPAARPTPDGNGDGEAVDPDVPAPATESPPSTSTTTSTTSTSCGGPGMYEAAVTRLAAAADACGVYRTQLSGFTDRLAGQGWGEQVTGPLSDSLTVLADAESAYRDLASQMRAQGDQGRDAYEAAPYVPGPHAVL
ncbi:hypothetical protein Ae717Ps2_6492c [Pseudonocardia sp. Ae717_Ps2]|uniref:hypothetical protein n=1 Tax=Pseudonocardia sp. Ae717_Ps2 TaxID=1885573 RepID=UPI00094B28A5|nr:hypothetical protein [Pseudonocardia sp. Ae717_Ps2]OLM28385.1 hypothetical protein Ae717Ps2_6444c [Pseudonocardia sp. Ae717_Ps2]OLM28433.1 hypothetical protein Ae717Ps2_6492c [Pseudonocardia sp. Ae717_Ps2]